MRLKTKSECSSSSADSPIRQSQHYRTLQTHNSSPSRPTAINLSININRQRDADYGYSKRWHTAPKEKHKVSSKEI